LVTIALINMNKDLHQLNELAQNTIVSTTISKNRLQRNIMRMKKVLHSTNATVKSIVMLLMGVLFFANSWGQTVTVTFPATGVAVFATGGTPTVGQLVRLSGTGTAMYVCTTVGTGVTTSAPSGTAGTIVDCGNGNKFVYVGTCNTAGAPATFVPPTYILSPIQVECWGGGGGGSGTATNAKDKAGAGGAGGNYVKNTAIPVTAATSYNLSIGLGGTKGGRGSANAAGGQGGPTTFSSTTPLVAGGGVNATYVANVGGPASGVLTGNSGYSGSYTFAGGNGALGVSATSNGSIGGGGGGAAGQGSAGAGGNGGNAGSGSPAAGASAGVASTGGGNGATGPSGSTSSDGVAGSIPGGGGSGGFISSTTSTNGQYGGAGGNGQMIITFSFCNTPTNSYNVTATANTICNGSSTTIGLDNSQTNVTYQLYAGGSPLNGVTANGSTGNPITFTAQSPSANTTYTVQSTSANSFCATAINGGSTTSKAITVNSRPVAAITSSGTSITAGNSTSISGTITASGSWTLTLSDASTVTGSGSGTWSKSVSPSSKTTYTISSLTDANCSSISADLTGSETVTVTSLIGQSITFAPITTVSYGVSAIDLSASVSASGASGNPVTYSISNISPTGIASLSGTNNKTLTINGVGTFTISADQAGNSTYAAAATVTRNFTVNKAVLTVTASNQNNVTYGTAAATVTAAGSSVISGYVGSDNADNVSITGSATYSTNYTATTAAASASITITPVVAGMSAANYSFSPANGAITVTQAALSITASNTSKAFGTTQATPVSGSTAFTSSGLKNGETIGSVTLTYGSGAIAAGDAIGSTSTISPSAATGGTFNAANYSISYNTGILTVVQITSYTESFNTTSLTSSYTTSSYTTNLGTWTTGNGGVGLSTTGITGNTMKFRSTAVGTPYATTPTLYGVSSIAFDGKIAGTPTSANLTLSNTSGMSSVTSVATSTTNSGTVYVTPSGYNGTYTFTYGITAATQTAAYVDNIIFSFLTPTTQATNINSAAITNTGAAISWTRPNSGANNQGCIVFVGTGQFTPPAAGASYTANTAWGTAGAKLGTSSYYCVYNGTGTSVTIASGLAAGTTYNVYVLEYNGIAGQSDENYYTATATNNPNTFTTTCPNYTLTTATQAAAICSGGTATISLTGLVNNATNTFTYTLNGAGSYTSSSVTASGTGTANLTIAGLSSSNTSMAITAINAGACTTTLGSPVSVNSFQVNAIPATPSVSNNGPICAGSSATLSTASVSGATYSWSGPNSFTSSSQNPSNASTAGTYSLTETVNGCTSLAGTTSLTVNSRPTAVVSGGGFNDYTGGSNGSASISIALTGSGPWNLTYTDGVNVTPTTVNGISTSPYTFTAPTATPGTYTYTVTALTDANCSSIAADLTGSAAITVLSPNQINVSFDLSSLSPKYNDPNIDLSLYASGIADANAPSITYSVGAGESAIASILGGYLVIHTPGTVHVTATQNGFTATNSLQYTTGSTTQTLVINKANSTVTPTVVTYTYSAAAQGPNSASHSGSGGAITYSYLGTGSTSYSASATQPTAAGTYNVTANLAADANYASASNTTAFTIAQAPLTITANSQVKGFNTTLALGTTQFTTSGTLYGTDAVTGVTLTNNLTSTTSSPATDAIGTYSGDIIPSAASGSGLSNYNITYSNGTLIIGTQYTETFSTTLTAAGGGNLGTSYTATGFWTPIGEWNDAVGGCALSSNAITTNTLKFNHGLTSPTTANAVTPSLHGVVNISFQGLVSGAADNLTLSGNGVLNYTKSIATTVTSGSTFVTPSTDSIFTFSYPQSSSVSAEYLDNVVFTFTSPVSQASINATTNVGVGNMTVNWTRPNSGNDNQGSIVFVGDAATASWSAPTNGTSYTANNVFGSGIQIGTSGYYAVYAGKNNTVNITGLTSGHTYNVYVLEYNGVSGLSDEIYNTISPATTSQLIPTCVAPTFGTVAQTGIACVGAGATIALTGLVPSTSGLTVSYTINGGSVQTVTGVNADATGAASFISVNVNAANNGQNLAITKITDGTCNTAFSSNNTIALAVQSSSVGGTVAAAQTICTGSTPANLTLTGNTGSVVNWQSATNSGFTTGVNTIAGTSTTLSGASIGSLTSNTYFRAVVQNSTCATANSSSVLITVNSSSVGGTTAYAGSAICSGNSPTASLTLSGNTGTIAWQKSTDPTFATGVTSVTGTSATLTAATIGALTATTYFRATSTSGVCATAYSSTVTVTVNPPSNGGSITYSGASICPGSTPSNIMVVSTATGTVQWQSSTDGNTWVAASGSVNGDGSFSPSAISVSTLYRIAATSGSCAVAYSNAVTITVNTPSFVYATPTVYLGASPAFTATYTTETGESNYSWTLSGTSGTDYILNTSNISNASTINVTWLTSGTQTVSINYTPAGCSGTSSASTAITTVGAYSNVATDYFKTVSDGNWATAANWNTSPNGINWFSSSIAPDSTANSIAITNNITVAAKATAKALTVTGSVTINYTDTLYIKSASTLTLNGTLSNSGGLTLGTGATMSVTATGTYNHAENTGTIPTATWNTTSNCNITGQTSTTVPSGLTGQSFGNFTWNSNGQTGTVSLGGNLTTVSGNLSILNTGTGSVTWSSSTSAKSISVGGDLIIGGANAATFTLSTGSGAKTIAVGGNVNIASNGVFTATSGADTLKLIGTSKTINVNTASTSSFALINVKIGDGTNAASYQLTSDFKYNTVNSTTTSFTVNSNSSLDLNGHTISFDNANPFTLASATGKTTGVLTINNGTINLTSTTNQNVPTINYYNLTINNSGTKTADTLVGNTSVFNALTLSAGKLVIGTKTLTLTGATLAANGGASDSVSVNGTTINALSPANVTSNATSSSKFTFYVGGTFNSFDNTIGHSWTLVNNNSGLNATNTALVVGITNAPAGNFSLSFASNAINLVFTPTTVSFTGTSTFTYNASAQSPLATVNLSGAPTPTYTYTGTGIIGSTATAPTNVGSYQVVATVTSNSSYLGATSIGFNFTISKATVTVIAVANTKVYDGTITAAASPTVGTLAGADVVNVAPSETYNNANAGTTHVLTPAGLTINNAGGTDVTNNYTIIYTTVANGVIIQATPTISVSGATDYVYNGHHQGPSTITYNGDGSTTLSYSGINGTTYGPSATAPIGTSASISYYQVVATASAGTNYASATSLAYNFTISPSGYTWVGGTAGHANDWNTGSNWAGGTVPTVTSDVTILAGATYYPVLTATSTTHDLYIEAGTVSLNDQSLTVAGELHYGATTGLLVGSTNSSLTLSGSVASSLNFRNTNASDTLLGSLIISGTGKVSLGSGLGISSLLNLSNSIATLDISGYHLTLKSTITKTAEFATLTGTAAIIDGTQAAPYSATKVTVERYIAKGKRNYRDLGPSVANAGSVFSNWQESGSGSLAATYGIFVTGKNGTPGFANFSSKFGFDYTTNGNNSPSLYSCTNGTWKAIDSTVSNPSGGSVLGTKGWNLDPFQGLRALVRGGRNFNMGTNPSSMPTATTIRATGTLVTGTVTFNAIGSGGTVSSTYSSTYGLTAPSNYAVETGSSPSYSGGWSFIANPYACPVSWSSILNNSGTNAYNTYYFLDPNYQDATSGLQRYVTVQYHNGTTVVANDPTGSSTDWANYLNIQPGQGFWVYHRTLTSGLSSFLPKVVIQETNKVTGQTQTGVFRAMNTLNVLSASIWKDVDGVSTHLDGAIVNFNNSNSKSIGSEDAMKLMNSGENIAINESGNDLSIDGTTLPTANDVIALKLGNVVENTTYTLKVDATNFTAPGLQAFIKDALTNAEVPVENAVSFTPSKDIASYKDRFSIVFKQSKIVPVIAGTVKGNISLYPNPVTDKTFTVQTQDIAAGKYTVVLVNNLGQEVFSKAINHIAGSTSETITMNKVLSSGLYTLAIRTQECKSVYQTEMIAK